VGETRIPTDTLTALRLRPLIIAAVYLGAVFFMLMNPLQLFLAAFVGFFLAWAWYVIVEAVKLGIEEANYMERNFGTDVKAAARWKFGGKR
jgi:hypothetical protein